jgi:undecaprenyl diphosphate synthase
MNGSLKMPKHVSIIMDGNGRWAKARKLPRIMGHRAGAKAVRKAMEFCHKHQISTLSLFALSVENRQNRPQKEIEFLLSLFLESLRKHTAEMHKNNIRVNIIGDRSLLSDVLRRHVEHTEQLTEKNNGLRLLVAIDYSGRWDIMQATQKIIAQGTKAHEVTEDLISSHLCFSGVPEPDLLIRTSGEQRISNFMLWQCAYSEFYFPECHWPDFDEKVFAKAIEVFQQRERRFGYTGEQIKEVESIA